MHHSQPSAYHDFFRWDDLPFANHLKHHQDKHHLGLHMPGHGDASCFHQDFTDYLPYFDTTELDGTDNLNQPQLPLMQAQERAARLWDATHSFFVTTGSSTAVKVAVLSLASLFHTNEILCPRTVHQSFLHACALGQISPHFLPLEDNEIAGSPLGRPNLAVWKKIFARFKPGTPLFFTSPDYFGSSYELNTVITLAHSYHLPVIVDQAHGSHFVFCPWQKNLNAPTSGADITIHSLHKTMPALTPAALLHIGKPLVDQTAAVKSEQDLLLHIQRALQVMQTTSPSFMIGASIDYACAFGAKMSPSFWQEKRILLIELSEQLQKLGFICFGCDALRLVIDTTTIAPAEYCAQFLAEKGIEIEMHDWVRLVLLFPLNYERSWNDILLNAFRKLAETPFDWSDTVWKTPDNLRRETKAYYEFLLKVPDKMSCTNRPPQLSALLQNQLLIPYPPGIPVRWPQERWSAEEKSAWQKLSSRLFDQNML